MSPYIRQTQRDQAEDIAARVNCLLAVQGRPPLALAAFGSIFGKGAALSVYACPCGFHVHTHRGVQDVLESQDERQFQAEAIAREASNCDCALEQPPDAVLRFRQIPRRSS